MFKKVSNYDLGDINGNLFQISVSFDEEENFVKIEYIMNKETVFYQNFDNSVDIVESDLPEESVINGFFQWHDLTFNGSTYIGNQ